MTIEQQLLEARDLIKAKRYTEAWRLLKTLQHQHPKAREWLTKLNEIAPEVISQHPLERDDVAPPPLSPSAHQTYDSPYQDEKPKRDSLQAEFEETIAQAKDLIRQKRFQEARDLLYGLEHPAALHLLSIIKDLEKNRVRRGNRQFNWILFTVIFLLSFAGIGVFTYVATREFVSTSLEAHTYEDQLIKVDYTVPWIKVNDLLFGCRVADYCKLLLQHATHRNLGTFIGWQNIDYFASSEQIGEVIQYSIPGEFLWIEQITFSGVPATEFAMLYDYQGHPWYATGIIYPWGPYFVMIVMGAWDEAEYYENKADFDELLNSLQMKTG